MNFKTYFLQGVLLLICLPLFSQEKTTNDPQEQMYNTLFRSNINFGKGYVRFYNAEKKESAYIGTGKDGSGLVIFRDGKNQVTGRFSASDYGGVMEWLNTSNGKIIQLGPDANQSGLASIFDNSGKARVQLGVNQKGGFSEILNPTGKPILHLGTSAQNKGIFWLSDSEGNLGSKISMNKNGGYAEFLSTAKVTASYIGVNNQGSGLASFSNQNGKNGARIGVVDNSGFAQLFNSNEKETIFLGTTEDESGMISLNNGEGNEGIRIQASENGGVAQILNATNQPIITLGTNKQGNGSILINGEKAHDYAEVFEVVDRTQLQAGAVVSMREDGAGLIPANTAYDIKVVGVISGGGAYVPGMIMGSRKDGTQDFPVAVNGQVYVQISLENGAIKVGDLLVSASQTGKAMKATNHSKSFGAIIGKALEPYDGISNKSGLVKMLVMVR